MYDFSTHPGPQNYCAPLKQLCLDNHLENRLITVVASSDLMNFKTLGWVQHGAPVAHTLLLFILRNEDERAVLVLPYISTGRLVCMEEVLTL